MKPITNLEQRLMSWRPRGPSGKVQASLFKKAGDAAEAEPGVGFGWLLPATAALMLMAGVVEQSRMGVRSELASGSLMAAALSNQSAAPYLGATGRNRNLLGTSFEWTNATGSPSMIRSLSSSRGHIDNE